MRQKNLCVAGITPTIKRPPRLRQAEQQAYVDWSHQYRSDGLEKTYRQFRRWFPRRQVIWKFIRT